MKYRLCILIAALMMLLQGTALAVTLPGELQAIEESAFEGDAALAGVAVLPDGVIFVGSRAFAETGLHALVLPVGCGGVEPDVLELLMPKFDLEWRRITSGEEYKLIDFLDFNARANDRYTVYLGGPAGPWTYAECDNGQEENCLVITDSFGLPFVNMVATNYGQVHYLDTRYYKKSAVGYTVKEMMEKYNITDVYVIVGDLHSYGSSFINYDLSDQLGD